MYYTLAGNFTDPLKSQKSKLKSKKTSVLVTSVLLEDSSQQAEVFEVQWLFTF
jgi:hypothetical protein